MKGGVLESFQKSKKMIKKQHNFALSRGFATMQDPFYDFLKLYFVIFITHFYFS